MIKLWHISLLTGMVFIFLIFFFFVLPGEDQLLDSMVSTGPNITLDAWREIFRAWATFSMGIALFMAVLWFMLGQWVFSLNRWVDAKKRPIWWALFALSLLLGVVPGFLLTPGVQEWGRLTIVFYLVNNLCVYYLATVLCSPSSFKYTPAGAMTLRRW